jgi:hypothetical protein
MSRGCYALRFATFVSQADEITTSVIQYSNCDLSHWSWFGMKNHTQFLQAFIASELFPGHQQTHC